VKWDEVEREFVIIASDFERLAKSFRALGHALHRERGFDTTLVTRGDDPPEAANKAGDLEFQIPLPFREGP